eukprot:653302-Rhodomonas_salina.3
MHPESCIRKMHPRVRDRAFRFMHPESRNRKTRVRNHADGAVTDGSKISSISSSSSSSTQRLARSITCRVLVDLGGSHTAPHASHSHAHCDAEKRHGAILVQAAHRKQKFAGLSVLGECAYRRVWMKTLSPIRSGRPSRHLLSLRPEPRTRGQDRTTGRDQALRPNANRGFRVGLVRQGRRNRQRLDDRDPSTTRAVRRLENRRKTEEELTRPVLFEAERWAHTLQGW